MGRSTASALCLALGPLAFGDACGAATRAAETQPTAPSRQALRACIDRWNQGNMLSWKSKSVRIAIRALGARERSVLWIPNPAQRRCTVSLAARPGKDSWICRIDAARRL